jgi:predicted metal-binding membrane protein
MAWPVRAVQPGLPRRSASTRPRLGAENGLYVGCALALNSACFMTPVKSISFLVGVGPEARVDHDVTQCRRCWMRDCAYRRAPAAVTVHR